MTFANTSKKLFLAKIKAALKATLSPKAFKKLKKFFSLERKF